MGHPQHVVDDIVARRTAGETHQDISNATGVAYNTVRDIIKRAAREKKFGLAPVIEGFEIKQTATQTHDENGDVAWVKQTHQRGPKFEVPDGMELTGVSALVNGDDETTKLKWMLARKATQAAQTRDDLIEIFQEYRGKSEFVPLSPVHLNADLATVYPTSDLHMGMLAWGRELGKPWDLKIARREILSSASTLYGCTPPSSLGILLDLGDFTHNNDQKNETPGKGHQLDVDGRFPKIGKEAMRLRVDLIHMALEKHERVIYRGLPGNHDPEVAQLISIAMALLFENNPRVEIDDDPSDFWVYEHGVNMLCGNHGHKVKPEKLPGLMAARWPQIWGRTKVRRAWSGHIHHLKAGEENGAQWETLRTIAAADAFSHSHGYTAGRELTAWTYHTERGLLMKNVAELV